MKIEHKITEMRQSLPALLKNPAELLLQIKTMISSTRGSDLERLRSKHRAS